MAPTSQQQNNNGSTDLNRQEIQTAIAKAVELRALHAALTQGNSPTSHNARFPSPSPVSQFSAQDYPVFTPSYEDEAHQNPTISEGWDENVVEEGNIIESTVVQDYKEKKTTSIKVQPFGFSTNLNQESSHMCPVDDDTKSVTGSCANHINVLQTSPNEYFKSRRRNSLDDYKPLSSCNRCKPALITSEFDNAKNNRSSNIVVPLTDSHASFQTQVKSKGMISWLFPKFKKKDKNKNKNEGFGLSPNRTESEEVSQILNKDMGIMSVEMLKRELIEAHESRDSAIIEVSEMRSSFGELKQKLEYLESYCEELKKALKQAMQARESPIRNEKLGSPFEGNGENSMMPVSEDPYKPNRRKRSNIDRKLELTSSTL